MAGINTKGKMNITELDFDGIKSNLKTYLKGQTEFTDYDFEGSNLSTILDVLAYNTYITSYNANMVSNEIFIDSATSYIYTFLLVFCVICLFYRYESGASLSNVECKAMNVCHN